MSTSCDELPVLYWRTASFPPTVGEIAPLKAKRPASLMSPCWRRPSDPGSSSYQRTAERPSLVAIVCCVQIASAPPASGSVCATACVSRPSSESSVFEVPGCGTRGGGAKGATPISPAEANEGDDPDPVTRQTWMRSPASISAATTQPVPEPSLVFAGTGVNA